MKRITEYDNITTVSETDVVPIVDVSDTEQASTGSTRKGTIATIADYLKDRVETLTNKSINMGDSMPSTNVRCRAYLSSSDQTVSTDTITKVTYGAESYDSGSDFSTSTNSFTAPVSGYYLITAQVMFGSYGGQNSDHIYLYLYKDGGPILEARYSTADQIARNTYTITDIVSLSANEVLDVRVQQDSGSNISLPFGESMNYFAIHLLSV